MIKAVIFDCFGVLDGRALGKVVEKNQPLLEYIRHSLKGQYKLGLLSNVGPGYLEDELGEDNLELFDERILSFEVGLVKPELEIYRLAAERLGVQAGECVFVDDRERNVRAAEEVGMRGIVYVNFNQFVRDLKRTLGDE